MAASSSIPPVALIQAVMCYSALEAIARASQFLKRRRTILPVDFLCTLLCANLPREGTSLAGYWKKFCDLTGIYVSRSSFTDRFSPALDLFLLRLLQLTTDAVQDQPLLVEGPLARFTAVIARDSTVIALSPELSWVWPGTRKQAPAALKVHTDIRVLDGELLRYHITPGTTPDLHGFPRAPWRSGALYLIDRGYPSVAFWHAITEADAYFLTPLKANFKPVITAIHGRDARSKSSLVGTELRDVVRGAWWCKDFDVEATFWVRKPPHGQRLFKVEYRVVGVWNKDKLCHHLYVTNIPSAWASPQDIWTWYRLRWEVEIGYKVGKGGLGLDEITSRKMPVVQALLRAALLRGTLACQARRVAESHLATGWINPVMWVRSWTDWAWDIIRGVSIARTDTHEDAWAYMAKMTRDPNGGHRMPTRVAVQQEPGNTS